MEAIDDSSDRRLEDYRHLRDAELRRERGLFAVEGRLLVERLLSAGRFRPRSLLATPEALATLGPAVAASGAAVYVAPHRLIREVVGFKFHRGVLAVAERGEEPALETLVAPPGRRTIVVAEDVRDPENVGGIFRNALAFGVDGVLLGPGTADPLGRKALRVSAGAALAVPFTHAADWPAELGRLRAAGFVVIALTPDRTAAEIAEAAAVLAVPSESSRPRERLALLLGSEGEGLSAAARAGADVTARIGMSAGVDSLNVAVAAGIALHRLRA